MRRILVSGSSRTASDRAGDAAPFRKADGTAWGSGLVERITALRRRPAPTLWPLLLDAAVVACLFVLVVTGIVLMIFYTPSAALVRYHGSYPLLQGVEMSQAYASTLRISFDVGGGLLLRQAHHWAALLLPAALMIRLLLAFFTGAFGKPRRTQWLLLVGSYLAALLAGWSGYGLPDDLLAGTGLRIFHGVVLGLPLVGSWLAFGIFGGEYPGEVVARLYPVHIAIAPVVLTVTLLARFRRDYRGRCPQFSGRGGTEEAIVGLPWWPTTATKCAGMFAFTVGLLVAFGGLVQISPIWRQGPSSPGAAGAASQPDWYTAFLDGALRLVPPGWELDLAGHTVSFAVLVPLVAAGVFFLAIIGYPFAEQWISADHAEHHFLDRARNVPTRTALGIAGLVFYLTLWAAGSADVVATRFELSFNTVIAVLQAVVCLGPLVAFLITRTACLALQEVERERLGHGVETGVIIRLPSGGYVEVERPPTQRDRALAERLKQATALPPSSRAPSDDTTATSRGRDRLARLYFAGASSSRPAGRLTNP